MGRVHLQEVRQSGSWGLDWSQNDKGDFDHEGEQATGRENGAGEESKDEAKTSKGL